MGLSERDTERKNKIFDEIGKVVSPSGMDEMSSFCGEFYCADFSLACKCMDDLYDHRYNYASDKADVYYRISMPKSMKDHRQMSLVSRICQERLAGRRAKFIAKASWGNESICKALTLLYHDFSITFWPDDMSTGFCLKAFSGIFNAGEALNMLTKEGALGPPFMSKYLAIMDMFGK